MLNFVATRSVLSALAAQVALLLFSFTQTLHQDAKHHPILAKMYENAWSRFAEQPLLRPADNDSNRQNLQFILTGSADAHSPPPQHFDFLCSTAKRQHMPAGLRLFLVIGATLASAPIGGQQGGSDDKAGADRDGTVRALRSAYMQGHVAYKTLTMRHHIQSALFALLCHARASAEPGVVHELADAALMACAGLATSESPVLQPSQLFKAHILGRYDGRKRRLVVAARLPIDRAGNGVASSYTDNLGVAVQLHDENGTYSDSEKQLRAAVRARGACEEQPKQLRLWAGLAACSSNTLREVTDRAQKWCSRSTGAEHCLSDSWGKTGWHLTTGFDVSVKSAGGFGVDLPHRTWKSYVSGKGNGEEVVVLAFCEFVAE